MSKFSRDRHDMEIAELEAENEKLLDMLVRLMHGTNDMLCAAHDAISCKEECIMHRDADSCVMTDAMDICEELGIEVDE